MDLGHGWSERPLAVRLAPAAAFHAVVVGCLLLGRQPSVLMALSIALLVLSHCVSPDDDERLELEDQDERRAYGAIGAVAGHAAKVRVLVESGAFPESTAHRVVAAIGARLARIQRASSRTAFAVSLAYAGIAFVPLAFLPEAVYLRIYAGSACVFPLWYAFRFLRALRQDQSADHAG